MGDMAGKGTALILALFLARYFGPHNFGLYASAVATAELFAILTYLGFEQEFTRRTGRDRSSLQNSLSLTLTATMITTLIYFCAVWLFSLISSSDQTASTILLLMALVVVVQRYMFPFRYVSIVTRQYLANTLFQFGWIIALACTIAIVVLLGASVKAVVIAQIVAAMLVLLAWFVWLVKVQQIRPVLCWNSTLVDFMRNSIPFGLMSIVWIAYFNASVFLLSLATSEHEVGLFASAFRIVAIGYVIGAALANTFTPLLFEQHVRDLGEFSKLGKKLVMSMLMLASAFWVALFLGSDLLISVIIGPAYIGAIPIAKTLCLAVALRVVSFGFLELLTTSNHQNLRVLLEAIALALLVTLNLLLIPHWSGVGSAWAGMGTESALLLTSMWTCRRLKLLARVDNCSNGIAPDTVATRTD